jgi:hypothetical protein
MTPIVVGNIISLIYLLTLFFLFIIFDISGAKLSHLYSGWESKLPLERDKVDFEKNRKRRYANWTQYFPGWFKVICTRN